MTKTCNGCGSDSKAPANIPFVAHEKEMERKDRTERRLWIIIILLIVLLVGTNGAWIWYESQFETVYQEEYIEQDVEQSADDGGSNNFVGGDYYGDAEN